MGPRRPPRVSPVFDESFILIMRTDPNPDEIRSIFDRKRPLTKRSSHRPKLADLLKCREGVKGFLSKSLWKTREASPKEDGCARFHRSLRVPSVFASLHVPGNPVSRPRANLRQEGLDLYRLSKLGLSFLLPFSLGFFRQTGGRLAPAPLLGRQPVESVHQVLRVSISNLVAEVFQLASYL